MKVLLSIALILLCLGASAQKVPRVSKEDHKRAEQDFKRALELQKAGKTEEALVAISGASDLEPANVEYATMRAVLQQQLAASYLERGNRLAEAGDFAGAAGQFRAAYSLDPEDPYIRQRMHDVTVAEDPEHQNVLQRLESVTQINEKPAAGTKSFHFQGDSRSLITQIGKAFDLQVAFDPAFSPKQLRFDVDNVDFYKAMELAGMMSHSFWAPVSANEIIVAQDTPEMRKQYERMVMQTFYIPGAPTPTDLTDIINAVRTIFNVSFIAFSPDKSTISIKGPRERVSEVASFVDNVMSAKPEMMIDVQEFELDSDKLRQYGLNLPTSFEVFNIPSEIRRVLGSAAQPIIDQLNRTGTIDPSQVPTADLANLQGSPLLQPFIFFGKGLGLTGIIVSPISGHLSFTNSYATNFNHVQLRAVDGEPATFREGTRFPILTSTFNAVAISQQGRNVVGSTPQFQYVDLGLTLKATPLYHSGNEVTLKLDVSIQALGTGSINGVPELTTRSYQGNITVPEGEPAVLAGAISDQESHSTSGYPGIGQVPGLRAVLSTNSKEVTHTELLIVMTPHIIRKPIHERGTSTFWDVAQ